MVHASIVWLLSVLVCCASTLPIYYEDSHAGSFGFFAAHLDLEESYTLVLFDAHSDASAVPESDRIRRGLREVLTKRVRQKRIDEWRVKGTIQPFNWIEPMMPRPIERVIWVAADELSAQQKENLEKEAWVQLDWQTQVVPRKCGSLAKRFEVVDWQSFRKRKLSGKVVVSIDLDYFVGVKDGVKNLESKWNWVMGQERLEAVSFALSRPWQKEGEIAERLFAKSFLCGLSVKNAEIYYEPYLTDLNDRSEMAKSYFKRGEQPPRFNFTKSSETFRRMLVRHRKRIQVRHNRPAWERWLAGEMAKSGSCKLVFPKSFKSTDGVWRFRSGGLKDAWIDTKDGTKHEKVDWWVYEPVEKNYNLIGGSGLGKAFTGDASRYVVMRKRLLTTTDDLALAAATIQKELAKFGGYGILRLQAEVVTGGESCYSSVEEIRVYKSSGFIGGLEEQFGSAYVFGIGRMRHEGESGPETLLGNDCANFLVYAWRRQGVRIPWCNPKQLKGYLEVIEGKVSDALIRDGLVIHLGSHVAVLVEDQGVEGVVDGEDRVMHHLGGYPEVVCLSDLAKGRGYEVMQLKKEQMVTIIAGGDVCLAGDPGETQLLEWQRDLLNNGGLTLATLECCMASGVDVAKLQKKRFRYMVDPSRVDELKVFDVLSLANNHSGDGGIVGATKMLENLQKNEVTAVGLGKLAEAMEVKVVEVDGIKIGVIGLNMIETDMFKSSKKEIGTLCYPEHKLEIKKAIDGAVVDQLIVMIHWGNEYTGEVSDEQKRAARWLIQNGADGIVGSHSHHAQPLDVYQGRWIAYSLGNCIFAKQRAKGFNKRVMLKWQMGKRGGVMELLAK